MMEMVMIKRKKCKLGTEIRKEIKTRSDNTIKFEQTETFTAKQGAWVEVEVEVIVKSQVTEMGKKEEKYR